LADDLQAEVVQAGERGQVRAREGSVEHVEVFRVAGVGTSIIGRPRPLPSGRRAHYLYTLICDEPLWTACMTARTMARRVIGRAMCRRGRSERTLGQAGCSRPRRS